MSQSNQSGNGVYNCGKSFLDNLIRSFQFVIPNATSHCLMHPSGFYVIGRRCQLRFVSSDVFWYWWASTSSSSSIPVRNLSKYHMEHPRPVFHSSFPCFCHVRLSQREAADSFEHPNLLANRNMEAKSRPCLSVGRQHQSLFWSCTARFSQFLFHKFYNEFLSAVQCPHLLGWRPHADFGTHFPPNCNHHQRYFSSFASSDRVLPNAKKSKRFFSNQISNIDQWTSMFIWDFVYMIKLWLASVTTTKLKLNY